MSARTHQRSLVAVVGSTVLVLAACQNSNAPEYQSDLTASGAATAALIFYPPPKIPTPHPWVGKTIRITDFGDRQCMEPELLAAGRGIRMSICYSNAGFDLAQRFIVVQAGSSFNGDVAGVAFKLAVNQSLCLDVRGGTAAGGEVLQLALCNSSTRQTFHLPPSTPATGTRGAILTKASGYTMALDVGTAAVGTLVTQRPYNVNLNSQKLKFYELRGSLYWPL